MKQIQSSCYKNEDCEVFTYLHGGNDVGLHHARSAPRQMTNQTSRLQFISTNPAVLQRRHKLQIKEVFFFF